MIETSKARLRQLEGYLASDPENCSLIIDTIEAALGAQDLRVAGELVARLGELRPASFEADYFAASVAMAERDFERACILLEPLLIVKPSPNVAFNLAWSKAMLGSKSAALELLDPEATDAISAAAMLRTQLLHEAGEFDDALAFGISALQIHPEDAGLNSAMATLALDLEEIELARSCSARGGDHPEALAASGVIELQDGSPANARANFERSLAVREHNPRAWIGRGLTSLLEHDPATAAPDFDRGARQFKTHIGSWLAAGWAHYLAGDLAAAAQRFEHALAIDPNFAESHGSLAVIDVSKGDRATAQRRMATALRLDRECFSAVLAKILLDAGNEQSAQDLLKRAFETPLNAAGMTVAGYMAGLTKPTLH